MAAPMYDTGLYSSDELSDEEARELKDGKERLRADHGILNPVVDHLLNITLAMALYGLPVISLGLV